VVASELWRWMSHPHCHLLGPSTAEIREYLTALADPGLTDIPGDAIEDLEIELRDATTPQGEQDARRELLRQQILVGLLQKDPAKRWSAREALASPLFHGLRGAHAALRAERLGGGAWAAPAGRAAAFWCPEGSLRAAQLQQEQQQGGQPQGQQQVGQPQEPQQQAVTLADDTAAVSADSTAQRSAPRCAAAHCVSGVHICTLAPCSRLHARRCCVSPSSLGPCGLTPHPSPLHLSCCQQVVTPPGQPQEAAATLQPAVTQMAAGAQQPTGRAAGQLTTVPAAGGQLVPATPAQPPLAAQLARQQQEAAVAAFLQMANARRLQSTVSTWRGWAAAQQLARQQLEAAAAAQLRHRLRLALGHWRHLSRLSGMTAQAAEAMGRRAAAARAAAEARLVGDVFGAWERAARVRVHWRAVVAHFGAVRARRQQGRSLMAWSAQVQAARRARVAAEAMAAQRQQALMVEMLRAWHRRGWVRRAAASMAADRLREQQRAAFTVLRVCAVRVRVMRQLEERSSPAPLARLGRWLVGAVGQVRGAVARGGRRDSGGEEAAASRARRLAAVGAVARSEQAVRRQQQLLRAAAAIGTRVGEALQQPQLAAGAGRAEQAEGGHAPAQEVRRAVATGACCRPALGCGVHRPTGS
jgi:hypothetical protein